VSGVDLREQLQTTLGHGYTLERELGGGGMSRVYVADEKRLGRKVVVKVLSPDLAAGISAERFEREIQLAASLQQANIVPVLTAGDSNGLPYYTMPFVEGESLRAILAKRAALPVGEAVEILRDVARALAYAHDRGVVHRDIKPDNVLLSGGAAVVTDFGIAKALSASRMQGTGATLTQMGTSIGTPAYMSPEQAAGDPDIDHRADIYAFGCMAYELLVGHPPFHARSPQRVLAAHMNEAPVAITQLRADLPSSLADLVMRCLAKEPGARPQTATELVQTLSSTSSGDAAAMPAVLLGGPGMWKRVLVIYAVAFIAVAIVAKAAVVAIGLPHWAFTGALIVMALGLPVVLFTGYVHQVTHRTLTRTPSLTPGGTSSATTGTMATLAVKASPHVSWRRTTMGGIAAIGGFVALLVIYMVLRAFGIGPAGSLLAAGRLAAREPLLVADFKVTNADSSLSGVVTEAVRANLSQSSAISLVSPASVAEAMRRMKRPPGDPLDSALAHEIAVRGGIKAIVEGEVTGVKGTYVLAIRLVTTDSGRTLTSFRTTAEGPRELIAAVDELSRSLRGKIGESLKSVQGSPPLAQVTTASLEALRKFSEGQRANDVEQNQEKAITLLKEAVAIDSGFAMAWRKLAVAMSNSGKPRAESDSAIVRALRFSDRLTESERYLTQAYYYSSGPGRDRAKAVSAYESLLQRGDSSDAALNNLALLLDSRREYARAESLWLAAISRNPGLSLPYTNIIGAEVSQGKLREAEANISLSQTRFASNPRSGPLLVQMAYVRGDMAVYEKMLDSARALTAADSRRFGTAQKMNLALMRGQIADFERLLTELRGMSTAPPGTTAIGDSVSESNLDALVLNQPERAARRLDAVLVAKPLRTIALPDRPYLSVAAAYARAHRPDRARAILAERAAELKDTTSLRDQLPAEHGVLAEIAIAEGRGRDAVAEFRKGDLRPDGPVSSCAICLYVSLARAFDISDQPDSAIAMFEKYVTTPSLAHVGQDPSFLAGVYKRLAEMYDAKGNREQAISNYVKFTELWKNADAMFQPMVKAAKDRLAMLQRAGG
jgi:tRNA A-37 threonylcarbamoyl transferase component Bud32/tetratricopeptide (TPR) repeat protein